MFNGGIIGLGSLPITLKKIIACTNQALKKQGRQQLSRYHAADCASCLNEFAGWSVDEQIAFVRGLLSVFQRHTVNVISYSVPLKEFVAEFPEHASNPPGSCYNFLLKFLMMEMADQFDTAKKIYKKTKPVQVALIHDRTQYASCLLEAFESQMSDRNFEGKDYFSTLVPMSWEHCIPLQAADLIAYETFKESERKITGRKRRKSLEALLSYETFGGRSKTFDANSLHLLREALQRNAPIGETE